jgi:hypothetical protein
VLADLIMGSNECTVLMETPLIGGFVENTTRNKKSGVERQND